MKVWDMPQPYRVVAMGIGMFLGFLAMSSMSTTTFDPKAAVFSVIYLGTYGVAYLVWRALERRHRAA
ncbi:MAG TPA: hypothetical protein VH062_20045 [Polyangiaceae bacterium]|jgi:hypothetical protein|nr:hypothetical protein [Polyangiaceae bacterium]